ncbi:MAG: hypothetical protein WCG10_01935 [Chlamydiota bacterium]
MEKLHKQMIKELDEIISRAPDVDVEYEYTQFCELHEGILWDLTTSITGLLPRILLVAELMRFQKNFIFGGEVSEILNKIFNYAKVLKKDELIKNFSEEKRMKQMAKILERQGIDVVCAQTRKRKSA